MTDDPVISQFSLTSHGPPPRDRHRSNRVTITTKDSSPVTTTAVGTQFSYLLRVLGQRRGGPSLSLSKTALIPRISAFIRGRKKEKLYTVRWICCLKRDPYLSGKREGEREGKEREKERGKGERERGELLRV